ncbi:MAG: YceI family protein, partial [Pseudomonadota bacterium]
MASILMLASSAAAEQAWTVDPARSDVGISFVINENQTGGAFRRFEGSGEFDPEAPETAKVTLKFETGSFDTGETFVSEVVKSVDWLSVEEHPSATYVLTRLEPLGADRYRAIGDLTLRGKTREVVGEMRLKIEGGVARAEGRATLDRKAYGVGVGFT